MAPRLWEDERVRRGMEAQLARREERLRAGEQPVGWKLGLGTPAAMEKLGTSGPLVGFLTSATRLEPGSSASTAGWEKPVLEPEVAVHLARDVEPGAAEEEVRVAIGALGPAIELADVAEASGAEDPGPVLAGNVVHRAVLLGPAATSRAGGDASRLRVRVTRDGEPLGGTDDPLAAVGGDLVALVRHTADVLGAFGQRLRAGEVLITGSTLAPPPAADVAGHVRYVLEPLGEVEMTVER
jgi:2-keto-4-pentenoate hydratase